MDAVASFKDNEIFTILMPTIEAFAPLLAANKAKIDAIKRETFTYGPSPRHQLDVYYPEGEGPFPVLQWVYGGAFVQGDRTNPDGTCYNNLGAFFAARGILAVIADYRLVPHTMFPAPSCDVRDAAAFVLANVPQADGARYVVLAHSAGGVHTASALLHPEIAHGVPPLRALVLLGTPLHFKDPGGMAPILEQFYGTPEAIQKHAPLALLQAADPERVRAWPRTRAMLCERDPQSIVDTQAAFWDLFREKGGKVEEAVIPRHNHISPGWSLNSGQGEEWGEELAQWIKAL